jgi:glycosyltransferase involved in cell wall biosynthesis
VPVYNRVRRLAVTLDSVLDGCRPGDPVELLVVDDASVEDVRTVVAAAGARAPVPVRLVTNQVNLGLVGNWNRCFELANAPIVNVLHSDEFLARDALPRVRSAFRRFPGLGLVYSGRGESGVPMGPGPEASAVVAGLAPASAAFVARAAILSAGGFDASYPYSPDQEFFPRIARWFPVLCLSPPLARRSSHPDRHMFQTWRQPDFLDRYRDVRTAARRLAGLSGVPLERAVHADLSRAILFIVATSCREGHLDLAWRYVRPSPSIRLGPAHALALAVAVLSRRPHAARAAYRLGSRVKRRLRRLIGGALLRRGP